MRPKKSIIFLPSLEWKGVRISLCSPSLLLQLLVPFLFLQAALSRHVAEGKKQRASEAALRKELASLSQLECIPHFKKKTPNNGGVSKPHVCAPHPVELKHVRGKRERDPEQLWGVR